MRQHSCDFSLSNTSRADEEQTCQWLIVVEQSGLSHLNGLHYLTDGLVLPVDLRCDA